MAAYYEDPNALAALAVRKKTSELATERYLARQRPEGTRLNVEMGVPATGAAGHGGFRQTPPQSAVPGIGALAARFNWEPRNPQVSQPQTQAIEPVSERPEAKPVMAQLPKNYIRNERTGAVTDLGESQAPQQRQQQALQQGPQIGIPSWLGREHGPGRDILAADKRAIADILGQQSSADTAERERAARRTEAERERTAALPEREVQIGESQARTALTQMSVAQAKRRSDMIRAMQDPKLKPQARDEMRRDFEFEFGSKERPGRESEEVAKLVEAGILTEAEGRTRLGLADGGFIEGYADGGAIGRAQTQQLNPMVAQYGQYLQAAAQTGVEPVPFAQYINLLGSTRGAMQQTPTQFADGGDVSDLSRPLEGPGTGRSDSIPALIDGIKPAALSRGEFVLDEETTKYYGTKFLMDLQRKAKEALTGGAEGAPANG